MRATLHPVGGEAGCSHPNGPDARRWLDSPPPLLTPTINTAATATRPTTKPTLTGVRRIGSDAAVAIVRAAVVVGVLVTAVVLGNAVGSRRGLLFAGRRGLLGGRRGRLGSRLRRVTATGRARLARAGAGFAAAATTGDDERNQRNRRGREEGDAFLAN